MIAIKNMEIPSGCEVCDFRKSDPYNSEEYCSKAIGSDIIIHEKERLENCPLVKIVTCKNCKYWAADDPYCGVIGNITDKDFYCASAKPRD